MLLSLDITIRDPLRSPWKSTAYRRDQGLWLLCCIVPLAVQSKSRALALGKQMDLQALRYHLIAIAGTSVRSLTPDPKAPILWEGTVSMKDIEPIANEVR